MLVSCDCDAGLFAFAVREEKPGRFVEGVIANYLIYLGTRIPGSSSLFEANRS